MNVQEIISSGLLELYVMGQASPEEARDVVSWAAEYPEVAAEIAAIEQGLESYAQAYAVAPAANVKEKIMAGIGVAPAEEAGIVRDLYSAAETPVRSLSAWKWVAAASVVLLVGSAVMNVMYYNKYDTASKELAESKQLLAKEQEHAKDMTDDLTAVKDPNSMPVALKGMPEMPDAKAKIFWMQDTHKVMIDASALPDAPQGMQYQFWAIVDGKPVDGGMIITDDKGKKYRMQPMKSFGKAEAFAISLEKAGGSPAPTKVVSMGKII